MFEIFFKIWKFGCHFRKISQIQKKMSRIWKKFKKNLGKITEK